jgi:hypothetical protein
MAARTVFISYSHRQGEWVWSRLKPVLEAGGATVLIDRERFELGRDVDGQASALQDQAEASILVLSPEYLGSPYCCMEMDRAILRDRRFVRGEVIPVLRVACDVPHDMKDALYADLRDDTRPEPWDALLAACGASLGAAAPDWLAARNGVADCLTRHQSVNLVVNGNGQWQALIDQVWTVHAPHMAVIDLERGATSSRQGLVEEILRQLGVPQPVPDPPRDLVVLDRALSQGGPWQLALTHFDIVPHRPDYDVNLFSALRCLINDRQLVLLAQSRRPFPAFLPANHPMSVIHMDTIILPGRP